MQITPWCVQKMVPQPPDIHPSTSNIWSITIIMVQRNPFPTPPPKKEPTNQRITSRVEIRENDSYPDIWNSSWREHWERYSSIFWLWPHCRTQYLPLLNTVWLDLAHWSRSLCRAFLTSSVTPNWYRTQTYQGCTLSPQPGHWKMLNRTGPTLSLGERHLWAATSWTAVPSLGLSEPSQFFTQQTVHLSKPWAASCGKICEVEFPHKNNHDTSPSCLWNILPTSSSWPGSL